MSSLELVLSSSWKPKKIAERILAMLYLRSCVCEQGKPLSFALFNCIKPEMDVYNVHKVHMCVCTWHKRSACNRWPACRYINSKSCFNSIYGHALRWWAFTLYRCHHRSARYSFVSILVCKFTYSLHFDIYATILINIVSKRLAFHHCIVPFHPPLLRRSWFLLDCTLYLKFIFVWRLTK